MTPRVRALIGIVTAFVFLFIGVSLWSEEQPLVGGLLMFLGLLRGAVAAWQARHAFFPED